MHEVRSKVGPLLRGCYDMTSSHIRGEARLLVLMPPMMARDCRMPKFTAQAATASHPRPEAAQAGIPRGKCSKEFVWQ